MNETAEDELLQLPFEEDLCQLKQDVDERVAVFERRHDVFVSAKMHIRPLQQTALRAWFVEHWRLPKNDGERRRLAQKISRTDLRMRVNRLFCRLGLPPVSDRSHVWSEWFMETLLGLNETEAKSGKEIYLVPIVCISSYRRSIERILQQLPVY